MQESSAVSGRGGAVHYSAMQCMSSAVHLYVRPAGVCKRDIAELYMGSLGAALGLGMP